MLLCEAAGYDVIIVETVGVGQSETTVAGMVDLFCLLQLPNAGDDLQAIKKGIVEIADMVIINKADIDPQAPPWRARSGATRSIWCAARRPHWEPPVIDGERAAAEGRHGRLLGQCRKISRHTHRQRRIRTEAPAPVAGLGCGN